MFDKGMVVAVVISVAVHTFVIFHYTDVMDEPISMNVSDVVNVSLFSTTQTKSDGNEQKESIKKETVKKPIKKQEVAKTKPIEKIIPKEQTEDIQDINDNHEALELAQLDTLIDKDDNDNDETATSDNATSSDNVDDSSNTKSQSIASMDTALRSGDKGYTIPKPRYPSVARRYGYEGITIYKITLDSDLQITDITLVASSGYNVLDKSALDAVKKGTFTTVREREIEIAVKFQLSDI